MEVLEMEEAKKSEMHLASAAAFVEGGIQESCDDACSICLEDFCESDPSTVTNCKHEYHLQCILEWCQRSSDCPMCLQTISLKDPSSQELFEAVERERKFRAAPSRTAAIFRHPTLGDFELQHLPVGASDSDLEERIIQHLAAAAAMGRSHHFSRREGHRNRQPPHGRPHFLVFSTHPSTPSAGHVSSSPQVGEENEQAARIVDSPSAPLAFHADELPQESLQFPSAVIDQSSSASGSTVIPTNRQGVSFNNRSSSSHSSPSNQDRAGPSELQSFSDSLKSRLNAVSTRYKEISRSTRGWKERLFSRNSSMSEIGSEVRREVNAGIASVSRMMERLETRDDNTANRVSISTQTDYSVAERSNQNNTSTRRDSPLGETNTSASVAASSAST
ncbi:E3 ubiquitin-protein ligase RHF2A [Mercurialis annua]|uniref:E3 ubiquitin-protein ligase RHF2A n=1 Tax=Mercurialis annua TaxID=3986 RepID=UPI00215FECB1|nr:E3 ubiquitin-protein ligase RHF2A [Mercurialis annua]